MQKKIIAIEIDTDLYLYQKEKFKLSKNLKLINCDFLEYHLPVDPYKVFANIPFSIEGIIIRKLLNTSNPPEDCYLVMRKDLAERLSGTSKEGQFSLWYKPFFDFKILYFFKRTEFKPVARMDVVLLSIKKREFPLIPYSEQKRYMFFIREGFKNGRELRHTLISFFTRDELIKTSLQLKFSIKSRPSHLSLKQWIQLFKLSKYII